MRIRRQHTRATLLVLASASLILLAPVVSQQSASAPQAQNAARAQSAASPAPPLVLTAAERSSNAASISEEDVRQQMQGKTFYLRRGYLGDSLHFNETGALDGSAPEASYTLSLVEIERVHLQKHHIEFECVRYGLHFLGALATEDQLQAADRVRLTSKKKPLRITIDREQVTKSKKEKQPKQANDRRSPASAPPAQNADDASDLPARGSTQSAIDANRGRTSTTSQAQANLALANALDSVFAAAIDDSMIATLPEYWRLFYRSAAAHQLYKPDDAAILRDSDVDRKAKLASIIDPQSNEYAQKNGVAGMAMYSVVVGADGKPEQVAVGRPIGFGLDENAVAAIRNARFQPAMKDGTPVPVLIDLVVQFRIYSKLTANESASTTQRQPGAAILPGPYTANAPRLQPQPTADAAPQAETAQPSAQAADAAPATQPAPAEQPSPAQVPQPNAPQ